jgi:hypothetical protein
MTLPPDMVVPVASVASIGVILRYGPEALLRLAAGLVAIVTKDKRSRADRALDVLRALRRDGRPPPT